MCLADKGEQRSWWETEAALTQSQPTAEGVGAAREQKQAAPSPPAPPQGLQSRGAGGRGDERNDDEEAGEEVLGKLAFVTQLSSWERGRERASWKKLDTVINW